jgi:chemotaxis protein MotD
MAGLYGKTSSQSADAGVFAKALNDADGDEGSHSEDTQAPSAEGEADAAPPSEPSRFKSLNGLGSLINQFQGTKGSVDPQAAQTAASQQGLAATDAVSADALDLQSLGKNNGVQAEPSDKALQGQVGAGAAMDLAADNGLTADVDLAALAISLSLKRTGTSGGEAQKADGEVQLQLDAATDADAALADGAMTSDAATLNPFSAQALLQLTGANTGTPTINDEDAQGGLAAATGVVAAGQGAIETEDDQSLPPPASEGEFAPDTADEAKPFRFQKAGEVATAVSLSVGRGTDGAAELQEAAASTGSVETVTVLDSRRYLGFGLGSNASQLVASVSGDKDWTAAMQPSATLSDPTRAGGTGNVVNTLKLELTPDHLGTVTAKMRLVGDELSIHLTVHTSLAYRELSDDSRPMLEALRSQGFNVDQVTISMAPATDTSSNRSGDQQQQANGNPQGQQQAARDGEASRQQQQRQGRIAENEANSGMESRREITTETGRAGTSGSGDVYL